MSWPHDRATWLTTRIPFSWMGMLIIGVMAVLALPTLQSLAASWQRHPDYTHGWLVLPVVCWLFVRAQPWNAPISSMPSLGTMTMLAGGMLHLASQVILWPLLDYAGWVLLIRGLALGLWGREAARRLLPVLAFGILLFPLPATWLNALATFLQNLIARTAELGLSPFWVCYRRGHMLELAGLDEPLSVAVECSGVRQLMVFVALSWFLTFFLHGTWWRRVALVLASIPLAIVANVLRVVSLAVLAKILGPDSIGGLLHDVPLLLTLPLGAILLWGCFNWLNDTKAANENSELQPNNNDLHSSNRYALISLSALLVLQVCLQIHLNSTVTSPSLTRFSFDNLPWKLGNWQGQAHPESDRVMQQADFADAVAIRAYADQKGRAAAVYLVFSATGKDRLHHPEICLRDAGGAVEIKADRQSIALQSGTSRFAERFRYQRQRHERTVVYYWHYTLIPASKNEQSLLQRIQQKQNDQWPGITVQVQTNMSDPSAWHAIETTLLPELDRWLQSQLPANSEIGSGRLPVRFTFER